MLKKNSPIVRLSVNGDIIARFNNIEEVLEKTTYARGTVERNLLQSLKGFNCGWRYENSGKEKMKDLPMKDLPMKDLPMKAITKWPKKCIEEYNTVTGKVLRHYMTIEDAASAKNISVDRIKMYLNQPLSQRTTDPYGNGFSYTVLTEEQARKGMKFLISFIVNFTSNPTTCFIHIHIYIYIY